MPSPPPPISQSPPDGKALRWALATIACFTLLRLLVAAVLPAGVDESYAIVVSRQLSLSYFDHPPLHFWLVGGWARLWGSENLLLLRLPFVALFALASWLMFTLTRRLFGPSAGLWALLAFNLAPVFGLVHGANILPDGPLLTASLAMANILAALLFSPHPERVWGWALAGFCAGLAMLSKYHGLLLAGSVLLFLLTSPAHRPLLRTPGPWPAAAIAFLMFTPVIVWNAMHDWASFRFQSGRGLGATLNPAQVADSLLNQSYYLLPWLALPLALVLVRALAGGPPKPESWFLALLALPPVLVFTALTLFAPGLPHWQMPGWLFALPLLGAALAGLGQGGRRVAAGTAGATMLLIAVLTPLVLAQVRWGSFDVLTYQLFRDRDPTNALSSWESVGEAVRARATDDRTFVAAFTWIRAAQIGAATGPDIPVVCLCSDMRHFAYGPPLADFAGWTGIIVDAPGSTIRPVTEAQFETLSTPQWFDIMKNARSARPLEITVGTGFRP
jgi:hypothetical protein